MVTDTNTNDQPVSNWPFPTKDNPLKPWTPKEVKAYAKLQREKAEEAPF